MKKIIISLSVILFLFVFYTSSTNSVYATASGGWQATSLTNAPLGRAKHTAVWTGTEMIVWGGMDGANALNSGGRYDPITNTWRSTSLTNAPNGQYDHVAIWTGTEMIVWGGNNINTGARYNPETDSWRTISAIGAPSSRSMPSVVWTGTEMILWGGEGGANHVFGDGARYNPSTDTWRPISIIGAPTARRYHKAVWTGTEMVIWGGSGFDEPTNSWPSPTTSARYNPSTDTWRPISLANAPPQRNLPAVVWIGNEMIVAGNESTVGRYNPSTDTWQGMSSVNAPNTGGFAGIVWTGNEVIVWGDTSLNNNARYSPTSNSWFTLTKVNAPPSDRRQLTAVWTGDQMIVWGGSDTAGSYVNTGGMYSIPVCASDNFVCGGWNECQIGGQQTRTCNKVSECDGGIASPTTTQSCTYVPPVCSSWTYSGWGSCLEVGQQTRIVASSSPSGCVGGNPTINQSCTYTPLCTANSWKCGDWNSCSSDNKQTRSCTKTNACEGGVASPSTTQPCNYIAPVCSSWTYSGWGACSEVGQQTRTITTSLPNGCAGGNPSLQQSCTPACSIDTWTCGAWNQCSSNGTQSRSCTKSFDCPTTETPSPSTSQNCTPPIVQKPQQPSCSEDQWSCGEWGSCSLNGIQSRKCKRTFDCPSVEDPSPSTSQSCDVPITTPNQPQPQQPQNQVENIDRNQIFRATVKLLCVMPDKKNAQQGSGTVIDQYGTILTNRHVVQGTIGSCFVGFINGEDDIPSYNEIADAKNISSDRSANGDMALLKIRNPENKQFSAIDIWKGDSGALKSGVDTILPFGYPNEDLFGQTITTTDGGYLGRGTTLKVCGGSFNVSAFFKTAALIDHGNSGGGAYQKRTGYFVGIPTLGTSCKPEVPSRVNYILSVNTIKKWLNSLGGYSVTQNNYSNIGNYFSSPVAIEEVSLSNLQALDSSVPTVSVYKDGKKKVLLAAKDGKFNSRTPTFFINGDQTQQGYFVYFGTDKKANPAKKGKYIRTSEFAPPQIKKGGLYYFIFKVKDANGKIGTAVVTEYRYKK